MKHTCKGQPEEQTHRENVRYRNGNMEEQSEPTKQTAEPRLTQHRRKWLATRNMKDSEMMLKTKVLGTKKFESKVRKKEGKKENEHTVEKPWSDKLPLWMLQTAEPKEEDKRTTIAMKKAERKVDKV